MLELTAYDSGCNIAAVYYKHELAVIPSCGWAGGGSHAFWIVIPQSQEDTNQLVHIG